MTKITLILLCTFFALTNARTNVEKRSANPHSICDPVFNNLSKVQCYCVKDAREPGTYSSADCFLMQPNVSPADDVWQEFQILNRTEKLTLSNTKGILLKYIPTNVFQHTQALEKLYVKNGNITKIQSNAFTNTTKLVELQLRDSQIRVLETKAFSHLNALKVISLDTNNIEEINRDVFVDLPSLETLFLTSNKIAIVHDKAFSHLSGLKELEINMNKLFSLNSETFAGLKNLHRLDLSYNGLEVIGDNTFAPLKNLRSLNLEENRIQMIDDSAFYGLHKLKMLSLAHNKLSKLENRDMFYGLNSLTSLSLKSNQLQELNPLAMDPILINFYQIDSSLDVEDNPFPCDCRLDWFMSLMNRTQSKNLKNTLENLKCEPNTKIKDAWNAIADSEKANFEDTEMSAPNGEYEYYDDSQLEGKLFYSDVRLSVLKCGEEIDTTSADTFTDKRVINHPEIHTVISTSTTTNPVLMKIDAKVNTTSNHSPQKIDTIESSKKDQIVDRVKTDGSDIHYEKKSRSPTTSRLATVSANPIKNKLYEDMASDEAKPDRVKGRTSVHEEFKDMRAEKTNNTARNMGCIVLISLLLCTAFFC